MLRSLLARLGNLSCLGVAPTLVERGLVHLSYLVGLSLLAWPIAVMSGHRMPFEPETLVAWPLAICLFSTVFTHWSTFTRRTRTEDWFLSHLLWLSRTQTALALVAAVAAVLFVVVLLFAAMVPRILYLAIYGPFVVGAAVVPWFAYRNVRGYFAFLKGEPVGAVEMRRPEVPLET